MSIPRTHALGLHHLIIAVMKISFTLVPLAAAVAQAVSPPLTNEEQCYTRHPHRWQSILDFCSSNDIFVPSAYASGGTNYQGKWTKITGNCRDSIPFCWKAFLNGGCLG